MKVGCFGGTFDPVHLGHLIIAEFLTEVAALDKILFIPAGQPPHKPYPPITPTHHRQRMMELAISDNPRFELSLIEMERSGKSYTVETLQSLKNIYSKTNLFLIIGMDNLVDLPNWKAPEQILDLCTLLVVPRLGFSLEQVDPRFRDQAVVVRTPLIEIASRDIRQRVREGKSIRYLVPEKVESYIRKHGLYRGE